MRAILIERDPDYLPDLEKRLARLTVALTAPDGLQLEQIVCAS